MNKQELVRLAIEAREQSYAPYSKFKVGAALITEDGTVFQGCNVENASYGGSICAERTAVLRAVFEGHQIIKEIAIVGYPEGADGNQCDYSYPCGICRQFLREFAAKGMQVYVAHSIDDIMEFTLEEMLPHSFGPEFLQ